MGKRVKKSRRKYLILEFVLLTIIVGCGYCFYSYYQKLNDNQSQFSYYQKILLKNEKKLKKKLNQISILEKEKEKYEKIDASIQNVQNTYFEKIKKLEEDIQSGKSNKKIAYLTFDDGPYYNTYRVLDILDQYQVKATFFTISMNGEYCYDNKGVNCYQLYQEYLKRGHTIANHTYTHAIFNGLYSSVDSFMNSVIRQEEHIKNQTGGYVPRIVRFPGGSSTAKGLKEPIIEKLRERGYGWVDWNSLDGDGGSLSSRDQAWGNLVRTLNENIEVILFHDYNSITTGLLPDAITYMRENGYVLLPLFYDSVMIHK